jgi:selenocysteine-specific elongation factor
LRHLVVGTAGHIDHGKSALVEALTGVHPDRLEEEQRRGITIDLGFADLELEPEGVVSIVDVPGHERFVRHMVSGASGLDAVMLVIAADDGVKPQTREHLAIGSLLGLEHGIIVLTKSDLVDADVRDVVSLEARELAAGTFLENAPVVAVSARTREGLDALRAELRTLLASVPERPAQGVARLPIDRSFVLRGFGTVVTGTLASGTLREGQEVEILPLGNRGRIRSLQVHKRQVSEAGAGRRVAVNLQGLDRDDAPRGATLADTAALLVTRRIRVLLEFLPGAAPRLRGGGVLRFHQGTCERAARLRRMRPDGSGGIEGEIVLDEDTVLLPGDRFILRRPAPVDTVGGGVVIDAHPARSRAAAGRSAAFGTEAWAERIARSGASGRAASAISAELGRSPEEAERETADLLANGRIVKAAGLLFDASVWREIESRAQSALEAFHAREPLRPGISREALRAETAQAMTGEAFRELLAGLTRSGVVRLQGDTVARAGFRVVLSPSDATDMERIEGAFRRGGLNPPTSDEATSGLRTPHAGRLLRLLVEQGRLVKIRDGRLFHADALAAVRRKLREFGRTSGTIDVGTFKDLAGVTRKNAIPLLEQFDDERLTRREGNARRILPDEAVS